MNLGGPAFTAPARAPISAPQRYNYFQEPSMRAEAEKLADAVRQSLALLRRHL